MPNLFKTIYGLHLDIGVSSVGSVWTYAEVAAGIDNVAEALNEVVQQYQFLSGQGFAENHVTGMAPAWTLSGKRVLGDPAQDYIMSKKYGLDTERRSSIRVRWTDASTGTAIDKSVTAPCTICSVQEWSGAATDDTAISFELRYDAAPTLSNAGVLGSLVVVSVAGATSGQTAIYVNPALGVGNSYVYKTGASVVLPQLGVAPGAGWTAWNGTAPITAATGLYIGVVEVSAGGLAVKGGVALVTAKV